MGDLTDELLRLLGQGQKIEAVRRYREATGTSLAEAKRAVDDLEAGLTSSLGAGTSDADAPADDELTTEVLELARSGGLITAIKRYREATGTGLKDAKEAVEALCRAHHVEPQSRGCLGASAVLLAAVLGVGFAALRCLAAV
jgi:ribosomal protein L7/L12